MSDGLAGALPPGVARCLRPPSGTQAPCGVPDGQGGSAQTLNTVSPGILTRELRPVQLSTQRPKRAAPLQIQGVSPHLFAFGQRPWVSERGSGRGTPTWAAQCRQPPSGTQAPCGVPDGQGGLAQTSRAGSPGYLAKVRELVLVPAGRVIQRPYPGSRPQSAAVPHSAFWPTAQGLVWDGLAWALPPGVAQCLRPPSGTQAPCGVPDGQGGSAQTLVTMSPGILARELWPMRLSYTRVLGSHVTAGPTSHHCRTGFANPFVSSPTGPGPLCGSGHLGLLGTWQGLWLADPGARRPGAAAEHVEDDGARPPLTGGVGAPLGVAGSTPLPSGPLGLPRRAFPPSHRHGGGTPLGARGEGVCVCVCVCVCACG